MLDSMRGRTVTLGRGVWCRCFSAFGLETERLLHERVRKALPEHSKLESPSVDGLPSFPAPKHHPCLLRAGRLVHGAFGKGGEQLARYYLLY